MRFLVSPAFLPAFWQRGIMVSGGLGVPPVLVPVATIHSACVYFPVPFAALALVSCVRLAGGTDPAV